jgi:hypothetical protein
MYAYLFKTTNYQGKKIIKKGAGYIIKKLYLRSHL